MRITIDIANILDDVRIKSHYEVANIDDDEQRYKVEAGSDKFDELRQSLQESFADLKEICREFLYADLQESSNDDLVVSTTGNLYLDLTLSPRRTSSSLSILKDYVHSFLVESVLAKFYISVNKTDLAGIHGTRSGLVRQSIERTLYFKSEPKY